LTADIARFVAAYHGDLAGDPHHRYRSWEHCYRYFRGGPAVIRKDPGNAALELGFFLASWGMHRGRSFLLQCAYTVHLNAVETLAAVPAVLWTGRVGEQQADANHAPMIWDAVVALRKAYKPFGEATDILVSKVLLGTLACMPACDRYFTEGFRAMGNPYSYLNLRFLSRLFAFCTAHAAALRCEQQRIHAASGILYPFMKLVDMYFWQRAYSAPQVKES
jgi:hypothetical protein